MVLHARTHASRGARDGRVNGRGGPSVFRLDLRRGGRPRGSVGFAAARRDPGGDRQAATDRGARGAAKCGRDGAVGHGAGSGWGNERRLYRRGASPANRGLLRSKPHATQTRPRTNIPEPAMFGRLLPREGRFYDLFNAHAEQVVRAEPRARPAHAGLRQRRGPRPTDRRGRAFGRPHHRRGDAAAAQDLHHADRPRADPPARERDGRHLRPDPGRRPSRSRSTTSAGSRRR